MIFLVFEIQLYLMLAAALGFGVAWLLRGQTLRRLRRRETELRAALATAEAALAQARVPGATAAERAEPEPEKPEAERTGPIGPAPGGPEPGGPSRRGRRGLRTSATIRPIQPRGGRLRRGPRARARLDAP